MAETAARLAQVRDPLSLHLAMIEEDCSRADDFDIIHFYVDDHGRY